VREQQQADRREGHPHRPLTWPGHRGAPDDPTVHLMDILGTTDAVYSYQMRGMVDGEHMDARKTLSTWDRRLSFFSAGLCLLAGIIGLGNGEWRSIGMLALGLGLGLRALYPAGGGRALRVFMIVLFAIAGTLAVVNIAQRIGS
jgi:hypothetical protein